MFSISQSKTFIPTLLLNYSDVSFLVSCYLLNNHEKKKVYTSLQYISNIFLNLLLKLVEKEISIVTVFSCNDNFWKFDGAQKNTSSMSVEKSFKRSHVFIIFSQKKRKIFRKYVYSFKGKFILILISDFCSKLGISVHQ